MVYPPPTAKLTPVDPVFVFTIIPPSEDGFRYFLFPSRFLYSDSRPLPTFFTLLSVDLSISPCSTPSPYAPPPEPGRYVPYFR